VLVFKEKLLICFTGVDGSGKTTHAKYLLRFLRKKGYSSRYVWAASRPVFLYPFLVVTRILGYWKTLKEDMWMDPLESAAPTIRRKFGALYRFLLFVDFELTTFLKVQLPLLFERVVICDRYVYDLIIDLALTNLLSTRFAKLMLQVTPTPKRIFLTYAAPHIVVPRRSSFNKRDVCIKMDAYKKLARILDFDIVDTSTRFETNQNHIRREVLSLLEKEEETKRNG